MTTRQATSPRIRKVTHRLDEELLRALKRRAADELTTMGAIIERALRKELKT